MIRIRPLESADWPAVEAIYTEGIADGEATFEVTTPSWESFDAGRIPGLRLVAVNDRDVVVGWVAASPTSARPAYSGVVEHSVYIARDARGQGIGSALLEAFIAEAESAGVWTIQSSIFPDNAASLRLHEALGFRIIGTRERIARSGAGPRAGSWRDTILIERRSATVGTD